MSRLLQSVYYRKYYGYGHWGLGAGRAVRAEPPSLASVLVAVWPAVAAAEVSNMGTASVLHS